MEYVKYFFPCQLRQEITTTLFNLYNKLFLVLSGKSKLRKQIRFIQWRMYNYALIGLQYFWFFRSDVSQLFLSQTRKNIFLDCYNTLQKRFLRHFLHLQLGIATPCQSYKTWRHCWPYHEWMFTNVVNTSSKLAFLNNENNVH